MDVKLRNFSETHLTCRSQSNLIENNSFQNEQSNDEDGYMLICTPECGMSRMRWSVNAGWQKCEDGNGNGGYGVRKYVYAR